MAALDPIAQVADPSRNPEADARPQSRLLCNLKTAKGPVLTTPPALLARADEVIG